VQGIEQAGEKVAMEWRCTSSSWLFDLQCFISLSSYGCMVHHFSSPWLLLW